MSTAGPEAFVHRVSQWAPETWWELEAQLFRDHPAVRSAVAILAPNRVKKFFLRGRFAPLQFVQALAQMASVFLPAVALVVFASRFTPADQRLGFVPLGVIVLVAVGCGVVGLVQDHRHPEAVNASAARIVGWLHVLPSALLLILGLMVIIRRPEQSDGGGWVVVVLIGLDVLVGLAYLLRHRRSQDAVADAVKAGAGGIRVAVGALDDGERAHLQDSLVRAIVLARSRGLIDEETAARAEASPLGFLGVTMAPVPPRADPVHRRI